MTALVEDDILVYTIDSRQTGTFTYYIHILSSLADTSASLQQQLSGIQQGLSIAIHTEVVIEAEVGISLLVLVVTLATHIFI